MDFFDDLTAAVQRDGARRGVRVAGDEWQKFMNRVEKAVPDSPQEAVAPVENIAAVQETYFQEPPSMPAVQDAPEPVTVICRDIPQDWAGLYQAVINCRNCPLCNNRSNAVFGEGNQNARLMFIGEGPGAEEDASGRPFVGPAGQLLDKMINAMHLSREDVYIANIVKCRPPGNRNPADDEAAACIGYLEQQIKLIRPEVIVLLGGTALRFLLKMDGITRCRGRWFEYNNIAVMPTFHPAFLLRKAESKREAWHDLKLVMARLNIPLCS